MYVCVHLDEGAQRLVIVSVELLLDLHHVHLAPCHHHPHQRAVISAETLGTRKVHLAMHRLYI